MTPLYLLDTNTVSYLIKRHPQVTQRLLAVPMHSVCISAITAGELAFGLAKRPEALALKAAVDEFLRLSGFDTDNPLDMARMQHGFFDQQLPVAESIAGLAASGLDGG